MSYNNYLFPKIAGTDELDLAMQEIENHIAEAQKKYGDFTSTHEALGVAYEEWNELREAVHQNAIESVREESIDLAAVFIRLAVQCRATNNFKERSGAK